MDGGEGCLVEHIILVRDYVEHDEVDLSSQCFHQEGEGSGGGSQA